MELQPLKNRVMTRILSLLILIAASPQAFAVSGFLKEQSAEQIASYFYILIGLLFLLLVTPLVQFYFAELKKQGFKEEQERNQRIIEAANTGVLHVSLSGVVVYANAASLRILKTSKKELLERQLLSHFDSSSVEQIKKGMSAKPSKANLTLKKAEESIQVSFGENFEDSDKTLKLVTILPVAAPLQAQAIAPESATHGNERSESSAEPDLAHHDLIESLAEKQAALNEAQSSIEKLLNLAPVAIGKMNEQHRITSANRSMVERLKYDEKTLKKSTIYKLFEDPEEASVAAKKLDKDGKLSDFHVHLKGKDEKSYPGELTVDLFDKQKREYLFWIIDRADEQFQRDKFENLLQHSGKPMAILTDKGLAKVNEAACQFFEVEDDFELFSKFPYDIDLNRSEEEGQELKQIIESAKSDGKVQTVSWTHVVKDTLVPCDITFTPIYKDQAFDSVLCLWTDLRELYQVNEALNQANSMYEEAEEEIEEKQNLLQSRQEELESKTSALQKTEEDLTKLQEDLVYTKSEFTDLQENYESTRKSLQELEGEFEQSRTMLADAEHLNAELTQQLENAVKETKDLDQQRQKISEALEKSESSYQSAQEALSSSEATAENLKSEQAEKEKELEALLSQVDIMKQEISEKDEQIAQVNAQITQLEVERTEAKEAESALREQLDKQQAETDKARELQNNLEQRDSEVQEELRLKSLDIRKLEEEIAALESDARKEHEDMENQHAHLQSELEQALAKLSKAEQELEQASAMTEKEKAETEQYDKLLEELQAEVSAAKSEAQQQKAELSENEEDWNQKRQEVETQRNELQQTLASVEDENKALQEKLEAQTQALNDAQSKVQENQQEQSQLQEKLDQAQAEIASLQSNIEDKEKEEQALSQQLKERQEQEGKELSSIKDAEAQKSDLQDKLNALAQEYEQSKALLAQEHDSLEALQSQLGDLEQSLLEKEDELVAKATALQEATQELSATKNQLAQQETQMIAMQDSSTSFVRKDIESLPLPAKPELWFDLRLYLDTQPPMQSLFVSLKKMIEDIEDQIQQAEEVIEANDVRKMSTVASNLVRLAKTINSAALLELTKSVEKDCMDGLVDNVSIRWPSTKAALQMSLRSVYEHLNE